MEEKTIFETLGDWQDGCLNTNTLWYDFWCSKRSLSNRAEKLLKKLQEISKSKKFNRFETYVFFKNNCPAFGDTYDDFRICDCDGDTPIYTVVPGSSKRLAEVWGRENNFEGPLVQGTWTEVKQWFLN
jgi:hypothetical protein